MRPPAPAHLGTGRPPRSPSHLSRKKSALWLKDALKYVQFSTRSQDRHCLLKVPTVLALEGQRQWAVSPADKVQIPGGPGAPHALESLVPCLSAGPLAFIS